MILLGRIVPQAHRYIDANERQPRWWGITIAWAFIGVVTYPRRAGSTDDKERQ